eukprot:8874911-Pyramimonas_sp.AAC.1
MPARSPRGGRIRTSSRRRRFHQMMTSRPARACFIASRRAAASPALARMHQSLVHQLARHRGFNRSTASR